MIWGRVVGWYSKVLEERYFGGPKLKTGGCGSYRWPVERPDANSFDEQLSGAPQLDAVVLAT